MLAVWHQTRVGALLTFVYTSTLQDPLPDNDVKTSEGIFVFTNSAPAANIVVGAGVLVSGRVIGTPHTMKALYLLFSFCRNCDRKQVVTKSCNARQHLFSVLSKGQSVGLWLWLQTPLIFMYCRICGCCYGAAVNRDLRPNNHCTGNKSTAASTSNHWCWWTYSTQQSY